MTVLSYSRYRFPREVIQRAVWMYLRFTLSFRDVEDLLAERGITVTYESIRRWVLTFGPVLARELRARRPKPHSSWHLDEMFVRIGGRQMYLWRAVDAEGEVLEVLVQPKRDRRAAQKLMRKLLKKQGMAPDTWVTHKCPAYGAALRELNLNRAAHVQRKRANNRAESSHVPVRRRERSNKASSRPVQLNAFSPCMRPPTTPSPFPVTSFQPARIGSSGQRRSRRGALRPAWPHEKVANVGLALPCADNAENKVRHEVSRASGSDRARRACYDVGLRGGSSGGHEA